MTTNDAAETDKSASALPSETPVAPFKHQHSFEQRYAAIINQQILENTINKEALQRQVQAFFPISRSSSRDCTNQNNAKQMTNIDNGKSIDGEEESSDKQRKILQKLETLDIQDKEET